MNFLLSGKFAEPRARDIFRQVGSAVSYLHRRGMIHRDIKAENVFFTNKNHVLLGDFGFAKRLETMEQHLTTFCGSPPYAAPELFVVKDINYSSCIIFIGILVNHIINYIQFNTLEHNKYLVWVQLKRILE